MNRLGVLGKDISYSLSPEIHKNFASEHGTIIDYQIYDIPNDPVMFINDFFKHGGKGLNITQPYKEIVAKEYGGSFRSVNCLYGNPVQAVSTDGRGLISDLKSKMINIESKEILVWGMGGAGLSIACELSKNKKIFVANRTSQKLEDVKKYLNNVEIYAQQPVDLVVFCIQDLDDESINQIKNINLLKDAIFYDINYKNDTINMLKGLGLVQHMNFYDGLGMLVEQAAESYNLWFNFYPTTEPVKKILYERL